MLTFYGLTTLHALAACRVSTSGGWTYRYTLIFGGRCQTRTDTPHSRAATGSFQDYSLTIRVNLPLYLNKFSTIHLITSLNLVSLPGLEPGPLD